MIRRLLLALAILPLVDIALLVWIGHQTSGLFVLALLAAGALSGAWLMRHHHWRAVRRVNAELSAGILPAGSLLDGLIVYAAAVLLILPGVISDVLAVALLLPPTRRLFKFFLVGSVAKSFSASSFGGTAAGGFSRQPFAHDEIIDARVIDAKVVESPSTSGERYS